MASPSGSGVPSASAGIQNSGSEERKRRRIISNRESARRARMRKRVQLDELKRSIRVLLDERKRLGLYLLSHQVSQLRSDSDKVITSLDVLLYCKKEFEPRLWGSPESE